MSRVISAINLLFLEFTPFFVIAFTLFILYNTQLGFSLQFALKSTHANESDKQLHPDVSLKQLSVKKQAATQMTCLLSAWRAFSVSIYGK